MKKDVFSISKNKKYRLKRKRPPASDGKRSFRVTQLILKRKRDSLERKRISPMQKNLQDAHSHKHALTSSACFNSREGKSSPRCKKKKLQDVHSHKHALTSSACFNSREGKSANDCPTPWGFVHKQQIITTCTKATKQNHATVTYQEKTFEGEVDGIQ
jgi:hypothetical protein